MNGVLCCGNLVLDIIVRPVDAFPWGTTTLVESIEQHLGGNGANTSYTLGKLGITTRGGRYGRCRFFWRNDPQPARRGWYRYPADRSFDRADRDHRGSGRQLRQPDVSAPAGSECRGF